MINYHDCGMIAELVYVSPETYSICKRKMVHVTRETYTVIYRFIICIICFACQLFLSDKIYCITQLTTCCINVHAYIYASFIHDIFMYICVIYSSWLHAHQTEKNLLSPSERLAFLGLLGEEFKASLKPLNMIMLLWRGRGSFRVPQSGPHDAER